MIFSVGFYLPNDCGKKNSSFLEAFRIVKSRFNSHLILLAKFLFRIDSGVKTSKRKHFQVRSCKTLNRDLRFKTTFTGCTFLSCEKCPETSSRCFFFLLSFGYLWVFIYFYPPVSYHFPSAVLLLFNLFYFMSNRFRSSNIIYNTTPVWGFELNSLLQDNEYENRNLVTIGLTLALVLKCG